MLGYQLFESISVIDGFQIRIITEFQKALPVIHLIKSNKLIISHNTCSWIDRFLGTTNLKRRQDEINEWKKRPDIMQFFDKCEVS